MLTLSNQCFCVSSATDLVTEEKVVAIVQDYKPKVVEKKKVEVPKNRTFYAKYLDCLMRVAAQTYAICCDATN